MMGVNPCLPLSLHPPYQPSPHPLTHQLLRSPPPLLPKSTIHKPSLQVQHLASSPVGHCPWPQLHHLLHSQRSSMLQIQRPNKLL